MYLLYISAGLVVIAVLALTLVVLTDRRWYKRHPEAEEEFARIDKELTLQGR